MLYSSLFCPDAQRVLGVLKLLNLKKEIMEIDIRNKPDWFLQKYKTVPALDEEKVITDVLEIIKYLYKEANKELMVDYEFLESFKPVEEMVFKAIKDKKVHEELKVILESIKVPKNEIDDVFAGPFLAYFEISEQIHQSFVKKTTKDWIKRCLLNPHLSSIPKLKEIFFYCLLQPPSSTFLGGSLGFSLEISIFSLNVFTYFVVGFNSLPLLKSAGFSFLIGASEPR